MNRIDTAPITDCTECRHYDRESPACEHPEAKSSIGDSTGFRMLLKSEGSPPDWCPLPTYPVELSDGSEELLSITRSFLGELAVGSVHRDCSKEHRSAFDDAVDKLAFKQCSTPHSAQHESSGPSEDES